MLLETEDCQLVLVDYQQRILPAMHDGAPVLANAMRLARMARALDVPVWATQHNPEGLGPIEPALRPLAHQVLDKMHFSAVAEGLALKLRPPARPAQGGNARSLPRHLQKPASDELARGSIVMAGCETHVCLMQTALDLLEEEFEVWIVTDACASRTERSRDAAFDRLAGAGAELVTTEMVAFEWLRTADHPLFRDVLAMVK